MGILIKNGLLVNADNKEKADILITDSRIQKIDKQIEVAQTAADRVIDASEMLVLPGGIDPHVHMSLPTGAGNSSDDFVSGSKAALAGGTTTLIDFVTPVRGQSLVAALNDRKKEAQDCLTDYCFHVSPVEWRAETAGEMIECMTQGITSFKIYMTYKDAIGIDDDVMYRVMETVAMKNALVTVHCEDGDEVERLRHALAEAGMLNPAAHPKSRPAHTESDAVKKAIDIAKKTGCKLYVVHVSAAGSVDHIRKARKEGRKVWGEACTQHLLLDESLYDGAFEDAAPYVLSPPLRKAQDRKALMEGLRDGTLQVVATDHCPFFMEQKRHGLDDFRKIANGAGGAEHRLTLLHTYGVLSQKFNMQHFVSLCSTNPAKIFGLYPSKGIIAAGSDADLVIWDPGAKNVISAKTHHQNSDINIYEGIETTGQPHVVIKGGQVAFEDGALQEIPPGQFLKRL